MAAFSKITSCVSLPRKCIVRHISREASRVLNQLPRRVLMRVAHPSPTSSSLQCLPSPPRSLTRYPRSRNVAPRTQTPPPPPRSRPHGGFLHHLLFRPASLLPTTLDSFSKFGQDVPGGPRSVPREMLLRTLFSVRSTPSACTAPSRTRKTCHPPVDLH